MKNPNRDASKRRAKETHEETGRNPYDAIVIYSSGNGSTMQYAKWIAEELNCDIAPYSRKHLAYVSLYRNVIYGGWIRAGEISRLNMLRQNAVNFDLQSKNVAIFGVGLTPEDDDRYMEYLMEHNGIGEDTDFYFFPGKFDKETARKTSTASLRAMYGTMFDVYDKESESIMKQRFEEGYDGLDREKIMPLCNNLIKKTLDL